MNPLGPRRQQTARTVALDVLLTIQEGDGFIQEVLDTKLRQTQLSPADRRLATTLTYGVLRRRGTLDALLRPLINREPHNVEAWIWDTLRLGAFQLAMLTNVPPHAALNETVELAVHAGRPRAKGFLNAVLRKFSELITPDFTDSPTVNALPLEPGRFRQLSRAVLPDPATAPVEYFVFGFGLPRWMVRRWLERSSFEEALRLAFWFAGPAPLWLRCNTLRTDRETLMKALADAGLDAEKGTHPLSIRLRDHVPIRELPGFEEGWFAVQDQASMQPASAVNPQPGQSVLDLCAAPGGKTTQLAALMQNRGQLIACDSDADRLKTLEELCRRLGVTMVKPRYLRPDEPPPRGPFDAVLVDVPCSNTGVMGRRPEVRWRLKPEELTHLVSLQTGLLLSACERVKPGGVVVYSTCSVEPEENRGVVEAVLRQAPQMRLDGDEDQKPGQPSDGGYWARLRYSQE